MNVQSAMSEQSWISFWRTLALGSLTLVGSFAVCIYQLDKVEVSKTDLIPIVESQRETERRVTMLEQHEAFIVGQLKAKHMISGDN
jgi:hypothetical protein